MNDWQNSNQENTKIWRDSAGAFCLHYEARIANNNEKLTTSSVAPSPDITELESVLTN